VGPLRRSTPVAQPPHHPRGDPYAPGRPGRAAPGTDRPAPGLLPRSGRPAPSPQAGRANIARCSRPPPPPPPPPPAPPPPPPPPPPAPPPASAPTVPDSHAPAPARGTRPGGLRRGAARTATVLVAFAGLLLAGCGDGGSAEEPAAPSATQVPDGSTGTDGGSGPTGPTAPAGDTPKVEALVAGSAAEPIVLLPRPGDDHLWLAERKGRVFRVAVSDGGRSLEAEADPVLDIRDDTSLTSEQGLLGLAFSPDGDTLYVSHTNRDGDTRVASYAVDGDTVDASSRKVLIAVDQPYPNHNGGNIVLGPDGKLWLGLGDGGSGDDPENRAQDPNTLLGKIVRVDPDGGDPEIVVSGVRNPWRFAFDTDDSLWIGDVGQEEIEEVDHLPAGDIDGANLGWSGYEGTRPHLDGDGRRPATPVPPVFEYSHDGGNCSITGGFAYHGTAIPELDGAFLFADYCAGRVRAVRLDDAGALDAEYDLGIDVASPLSFGSDADGEPYVLSGDGSIVRLVPAG
jgi:glucose/arabinose dehydrogenase